MRKVLSLLAVLAALIAAVAVPATASAMSSGTAAYWAEVDTDLRCAQLASAYGAMRCEGSYIYRAPTAWPGWGGYGWTGCGYMVLRWNNNTFSTYYENINTWGSSTQEGWSATAKAAPYC